MVSGPTEALSSTPQTWTMTIFERGVGRRVEVNVDSEEPLKINQTPSSAESVGLDNSAGDAMGAAFGPSGDGHKSGPSLDELTSGFSEAELEEASDQIQPLLDLFN